MLDNILIQFAMGVAALFTFLSALGLLSAAVAFIQAKTAKIKAETAMLLAMITTRLKPGKNGGANV